MPSKLSFHVMGFDNHVFDYLQQMQPALVKIFEFPSDVNVDELRRRCPGALIVYRQYTNLSFNDPADAFVAEMGDTLRKLSGRGIIWEGLNEPVLNSEADARAVSTWFVRFAQLMHARGERVAAFSFSTGNPRLEWVPLLAPAAMACDYIALHEYLSPTTGAGDWARYRAFRQWLPQAARKPILITECGLDDGRNNGWQAYLSADAYMQVLRDYDKQMLQDGYVIGGTIFQYGGGAPWQSFNIATLGSQIAQYVAQQGGGAHGGGEQPFELPAHIYGIHDVGGESLLTNGGRSGWVLESVDLSIQTAHDYSALGQRGIEPIVRLNNGISTAGTIPTSDKYDAFAAKCAAYVQRSPGARIWVIGNEMNLNDERPESSGGIREVITPTKYAECFSKCRAAIRSVPGHSHDWVVAGAVAPINNDTQYPGNERGDWVKYLLDILALIGSQVDALALHCYTQDYNIAQITSDAKMQPPFTDRYFSFRMYRDFLNALPLQFRLLPVLITETNPIAGWGRDNIRWIQTAYREINDWNTVSTNQPIHALALFRWKRTSDHPEWSFQGNIQLAEDLRVALDANYQTRPPEPAAPAITAVTFSPTEIVAGNLLLVSITVKNNSGVPLPTQGPEPGFVYEEGDTFRSRGFTEANGNYRVCVDFDNRTGIDHPYRWGFGTPLMPGETRIITGAIRLNSPQARNYWAGLVAERATWLQDHLGTQAITVRSGLEIANVIFTPTTIGIGQALAVKITVRNGSNLTLQTQGPDPGFVYEEGDTFDSRGFLATNGSFRVGVDFENRIVPGPTNTHPSAAVYIDNRDHFIPPNATLWYKFDYAGNRSVVEIKLPDGVPQQIGFSLYTPDQINGDNVGRPIGRGTPPGGSSELQWKGRFNAGGTYFVEVVNNSSAGKTFLLGIAGLGVILRDLPPPQALGAVTGSGLDHPYRWGFGTPLAPGETRTITGMVRMKNLQSQKYWAGLVQEFVAWIQDRQGVQPITVVPAHPNVEIVSIAFAPSALAAGELLNLSMVVRNNGSAAAPTQGPDPGFVYNEGDTFRSRGFAEISGNYRVGIDFDNRAGFDHPYRWGFGTPLAPGETRTITGAIRMRTVQARDYWGGLVQEFVEWQQDRVGVQRVTVRQPITITSVVFSPTRLAAGRLLNVTITVRNDSAIALTTQGPDPGFEYAEGDTFASRGFPAVSGNYRVGIDFDDRTGLDHPYRWGFGTPLAPGETRTITGTIRLTRAQSRNYWAGVVQEYVAWWQDRQGGQSIVVT